MIDLNLENFVKAARISEDDIHKNIRDEAVFRYYISNLVIGKAIKSPLKSKDDHPSFGVYYSDRHNILMFKDQSLDVSGDCVEFVRKYFNFTTKYEACSKIALDFGIENNYILSQNVTRSIIPPSKSVFEKSNYKKGRTIIDIQSRPWAEHDKVYWGSFGITIDILNKFKVKPLQFIFINGLIYPVDKYAYAYEEVKDRILSYKIYQPFSTKNKWLNNATPCTHQGYTLLPKEGELLIITKSLKDVMAIESVLTIPSIGMQNENIVVKQSVMEEYLSRYKNVVCLFDNDTAGKRLSLKYQEIYDIKCILIPDKFKSKDFSDLVKKHGSKRAYNILKNLLNEIT